MEIVYRFMLLVVNFLRQLLPSSVFRKALCTKSPSQQSKTKSFTLPLLFPCLLIVFFTLGRLWCDEDGFTGFSCLEVDYVRHRSKHEDKQT